MGEAMICAWEKYLLVALLVAHSGTSPSSSRRLFVPDDVAAIEQRLKDNSRLPESDRRFMEQLQHEQPPTIHKLDRFRLDDLLQRED